MSSSAFNRAVTRVQWPKKKRIHRQMLQLQPFSLLPHRLTLLNTLTHTCAHSHRWAKVKLQPSQPERMIVKHAHSIQFLARFTKVRKLICSLINRARRQIQNGPDTFEQTLQREGVRAIHLEKNDNDNNDNNKKKKEYYQTQTLFEVCVCVCICRCVCVCFLKLNC